MNFILISFLFGIFLADFIVFTAVVQKTLVVILFLLLAVILFFGKGRGVRLIALSAFFFVFAIFYFQFFTQKSNPKYISYYNNQIITLMGEVKDEPERSSDKTKLVLEIPKIKGKVLITTPSYPEYHFGDRLKILGKLQEPEIFNEFNYRNYLKPQGIYSMMYKPTIEKIGENSNFSLKKWLITIKNRFENTINKILPEPEAALANGLVLGVRRSIPDWLLDAFIAVGIIHIIALSGYNITIISQNLSVFFTWFTPRFAFWFSLFGIWLFVIMVGAKATIVRAALMGSLYLLSKKIGRRREVSRILLLTALFMVLQNPLILKYDSGFQLSFLATAGLVFLSPFLGKLIKRLKLPYTIKEAGVATLSAQVFVLPLLIINFKQISLIALLANILVLPFIPYAMFFIFLAGILGMIILPFGQIFGWLSFLFLKYIVLIADNLSKIPGAFVEVGKIGIFAAAAYWLFLGFVMRYLRRKMVI